MEYEPPFLTAKINSYRNAGNARSRGNGKPIRILLT